VLVDFYHLVASPIERVLPRICERLLEGGERLLVVAQGDYLDRLDSLLWSYSRASFLPHGQAAAGNSDSQPVLLSTECQPTNGANNVALVDGVWREAALGFHRAFYFFDTERIEEARASWKMLKDRPETERRYWKQDEAGKWIQGP
jgi:DNA polymerase-3 subunit chi